MDAQLLDTIADAVNPLLALAALIWAFARSREARRALPPWRFVAGLALGLVAVYTVHNLDLRLRIWPRLGLDYSTHSAFATSVATSLAVADRRWAFALVPVLVGYAWLMVCQGYHSPSDIAAAAALMAPLTWLCHAGLRRVPTSPATGQSSPADTCTPDR